MNLGYNAITAVPSELAALTGLRYLNLAGNQLTGVPADSRTWGPSDVCLLCNDQGFSCANLGAGTSCCGSHNNCGDGGSMDARRNWRSMFAPPWLRSGSPRPTRRATGLRRRGGGPTVGRGFLCAEISRQFSPTTKRDNEISGRPNYRSYAAAAFGLAVCSYLVSPPRPHAFDRLGAGGKERGRKSTRQSPTRCSLAGGGRNPCAAHLS